FVPEQEKWTISMPPEPKGAKWTSSPRVVSTLHYRQDQIGFLEDGYTHLFVVPAEGGTPRQLTSGKWNGGAGGLRGGGSIGWTPDSTSIVFDGTRSPDTDKMYEASQLYAVELASGTIRDLVTKPGNWGRPAVSPDGRTVAFSGHAPTGRSHSVSDLFVIPLSGGRSDMRKISADDDQDPLGAGRQRRLLRRGRQRRPQRAARVDRRRRQADHHRATHALVRLDVKGAGGGGCVVGSQPSAGCGEGESSSARPGDHAH